MSVLQSQRAVCATFGVEHFPTPDSLKLGIARDALDGARPLNGLRHPPEDGTSGWFIWGGAEFSEADDYFLPMHAGHLGELCPLVVPYLGLPPGWRFLLTEDHAEAWFDESLLVLD